MISMRFIISHCCCFWRLWRKSRGTWHHRSAIPAPPADPGETQTGIPGAPNTGTQYAPNLPPNTGAGKFWGYN